MTKTLDELRRRLLESADEVESFPHPSHCDHLHVAFKVMREAEAALRELIADAERWEKRALKLGWKEPDPFAMWYMHDNHLFTKLPIELEPAMVVLRAAFDGECGHYGMLCSKQYNVNCHARADWESFEPQAREWITAAIDAQRTKASE